MVATRARCGNRATVNSGVVMAQGILRLVTTACTAPYLARDLVLRRGRTLDCPPTSHNLA